MPEHMVKLNARFMDGDSGVPLTGPNLRVVFLDRDALSDDILGESALAPDGRAEVITTSSRFHSNLAGAIGEAFGEEAPDVYCEIREKGIPIFRSAVFGELSTERTNPVTSAVDRTIDLGTFRVERGQGLENGNAGDKPLKPLF